VDVPTTTTSPVIYVELGSNKNVISNILTIHTEIVSKHEEVIPNEICTKSVSNEEANSNLNVVDAATDDDDNSLNAKLKLDGEHSIGNLNGIPRYMILTE